MPETKGSVTLIAKFFGEGKHGRKCTMEELKKLSSEERTELADQIRALNETD